MRKRPDFIVGLTILVTLVALIASVLWMQQSDPTRRRRRVVAQFQDVGNARVGNAAVIRGVRAGRIQGIELADDGAVLVHLSLERDAQLPQDPVVLLNESSLFGEWQATIMERASLPRDESVQRQIAAGAAEGNIPGATLPDIAKLTAVAGQIAGDVAEVASRVDVAFDATAAVELRSSIRNFAVLSSTLAHSLGKHATDLDTMATQLRGAVGSLNRTAHATERLVSRADSSMSSGDLHRLIADLGVSAAELRTTTSTLSQMSKQLAGTQSRLDSFLGSGEAVLAKINAGQGTLGRLVNDSSLYVGGDSLVAAMRGLIAEIRANPKKFVSLKLF
jgi:phospholipid/cholesterol/gamma-HCH transport system substrate-binding protein